MEIKTYKIKDIKIDKAVILDSSSIITLNMINLLDILYKLKKDLKKGEFLIPYDVFSEIVKVPLNIKKYELRALFVKRAIQEGILKVIKDEKLDKLTNEILEKANSVFKVKGESLRIVHRGEASCIALYKLLNVKNKLFIIDERTTRMLLEKPSNLRRLLKLKLHTSVEMNNDLANYFTNLDIPIIRSAELLFVAFSKGYINIKNGKATIIDALLYGAKSYGCSISRQEIEKIKRELTKLF